MLTRDQIERLADTLNERVDIPFTSEDSERSLLVTVLEKIDGQLGEVGDEFHNIIDVLADGSVDDAELQDMKARAVEILNDHVDIPFVGEGSEAALLAPVVDALVDSARERIEAAMG